MSEIMQGTTPSVTITIDTNDFLLSDVSSMELYVSNDGNLTTYTDEDLIINTANNTITKAFSEEETSRFNRNKSIVIQGRFWFANGNIVGINKLAFSTADMLGVGN